MVWNTSAGATGRNMGSIGLNCMRLGLNSKGKS